MTISQNHFRGSIFYQTILYENGTISENGTILTILQSILYENGAISQNGTILTILQSILYENGTISKKPVHFTICPSILHAYCLQTMHSARSIRIANCSRRPATEVSNRSITAKAILNYD